jgi:hypothetical protein
MQLVIDRCCTALAEGNLPFAKDGLDLYLRLHTSLPNTRSAVICNVNYLAINSLYCLRYGNFHRATEQLNQLYAVLFPQIQAQASDYQLELRRICLIYYLISGNAYKSVNSEKAMGFKTANSSYMTEGLKAIESNIKLTKHIEKHYLVMMQMCKNGLVKLKYSFCCANRRFIYYHAN